MANPQPDEFTRIANELFEAIILANFKKRQLNIILLLIRLSYGCGRKYAILRQVDFQIIGIDKSDINKELQLLARAGVLTITGERIALNKDYDRWCIDRAQPGGKDSFKRLLKRNLDGKKVGDSPTMANRLVGETPTIKLVNHQPGGWQSTNLGVGKSPTSQTPQANGDKGCEGAERNSKETLKKNKEKKHICVFDDHFEKFWTLYPRQVEKRRAYRCYSIRIRDGLAQGLTIEDLVRCLFNAAKNYADECRRQGTQPRFIKHPATFLGPDKPYLDWIDPPAAGTRADPQLNTTPNKRTDAKRELIQSLYLS